MSCDSFRNCDEICDNTECYHHEATMSLVGWRSAKGECGEENREGLNPIMLMSSHNSHNSTVRVTVYNDHGGVEAFFNIDALRDMIDHMSANRGIFR